MDEKVLKKLEALKKQAQESRYTQKRSLRGRSSFHKIIKTKEQADTFMKLLRSV